MSDSIYDTLKEADKKLIDKIEDSVIEGTWTLRGALSTLYAAGICQGHADGAPMVKALIERALKK